jgi:hypothetical protein
VPTVAIVLKLQDVEETSFATEVFVALLNGFKHIQGQKNERLR